MVPAAPHRECKAALSSGLCNSDGARGNGIELCQAAGGQGKVLHERVVSMEQTLQCSRHGPKLLEFKER